MDSQARWTFPRSIAAPKTVLHGPTYIAMFFNDTKGVIFFATRPNNLSDALTFLLFEAVRQFVHISRDFCLLLIRSFPGSLFLPESYSGVSHISLTKMPMHNIMYVSQQI